MAFPMSDQLKKRLVAAQAAKGKAAAPAASGDEEESESESAEPGEGSSSSSEEPSGEPGGFPPKAKGGAPNPLALWMKKKQGG